MYNFTRQDAANILNVSTRSIDRYIKSWKIRTRKNGKIVYLNENDINILKWFTKQEVIVPKTDANYGNNVNNYVNPNQNLNPNNYANINPMNNMMNNSNTQQNNLNNNYVENPINDINSVNSLTLSNNPWSSNTELD